VQVVGRNCVTRVDLKNGIKALVSIVSAPHCPRVIVAFVAERQSCRVTCSLLVFA
jgi:hypothetical protein